MSRQIAGPGAALLVLLFWCTDTQDMFPCFATAVIIHEMGHLAAMMALGARVQGLRLSPAGLEICYTGALSHVCDAVVALAGPVANLVASLCSSYAASAGFLPQRAYLFSGAGIVLGLFNLLPAKPLDGAGILYSTSCVLTDPVRARRITGICTLLCGAGLCMLGLYILLKTRYNISMLASGSLIIGGFYAERAGKSPAKGTKARTLRWRRVWADQKEPERH